MRRIKTIFLDWNLPLLTAIAKRLLSDTEGSFIDLSGTLVIVPTVQSSRRLREALALSASEGLFPPEIVTPDGLLAHTLRGVTIASEPAVLAAWVSVFEFIDFKRYDALFPVIPDQSIAWQHGMARRIAQLRNELGEEGLDFQQVARIVAKSGQEPKRWQELAQLETLYLSQLQKHNLQDPKQLRREAAQSYQPSAHIERIVLAATPDPQPLILQALERSVQHIAMEVWVYGSKDTSFDDWGRPLAEHWNQRPLDFEKWGVYLQTVTAPKDVALFIAESMQNKAPESILIGLADASLNPIIADALTRVDITHYDPEGQALRNSTTGKLVELLCRFCSDTSISTVRSLLQHPDMQDWLGFREHANKVLQQLDRLFEDHLAPDFDSLIYFAARSSRATELKDILIQLKPFANELSNTDNFAETLAGKLQLIYSGKQIATSTDSEVPWEECAEAIRKWLQLIAEAERLFPDLPKRFAHTTLEHGLRNSRVYPTRPQQAHDLLGWLELLWNDAPHLILAGLNEGSVPESVIGDSFLPESLREHLGLRTNAQRFARDAYLLEALCRRRVSNGRIDVLIPQVGYDQDPLKPSSLLFQCAADRLIERTRKLFQPSSNGFTKSRHRIAWKLRPPPDLELPASFPVSALKSYLQCPFRFFLRHILRMRPVDVEMRELSPAAFGTLFHDTVAKLRGDTLNQTVKPGDLIKKLHAIAKHIFEHRYGNRLSFALRLQQEALLERIIYFAERQSEDIIQNGRTHIISTEEAFEISLEGVVLNGRIDRIDQRGRQQELIDYKTSNRPTDPEKAHLASAGKKTLPTHLPEEAFLERGGKRYYWTDLQLPLYGFARDLHGEDALSLAYFNLGQTVDKSSIIRWETYTRELHDSAICCAAAILRRIKAGIFWPPNQSYDEAYDDFRQIFPDGIENTVDAKEFKNYAFKRVEQKS